MKYLLSLLFSLGGFVLSFEDFRFGQVTRWHQLLLFVLLFLSAGSSLLPRLLCAGQAGLILCAARALFGLAFKRESLGLADIWFAMIMGFVIKSLFWWAVAMIFACLGCLVWMLDKEIKRISFIPFLYGGTLIVLLLEVV